MSYGVGCRCGSDLAWLWQRPAAVALIRLAAWELPYAAGADLKKQKQKENTMINHNRKEYRYFAEFLL